MAKEGLYYASKEGMGNGKYAFIIIEDTSASFRQKLHDKKHLWLAPSYDGRLGIYSKFERAVQRIFGSVLLFGSQRQLSPEHDYATFKKNVQDMMSNTLFNSSRYKNLKNSAVSPSMP